MRTAQLDFNVVVKSAFLRLRFWCSEKKQIKEFDDLCRYMAELFRRLLPARMDVLVDPGK
eukprot:937337-Pleurochrysis_carterae.AAC.1